MNRIRATACAPLLFGWTVPPQKDAVIFNGCKLPPTALPWYAVNHKDPNDQVFTKKSTAHHCWRAFRSVAKAHGYDLCNHVFLEPSAGEGCFLHLMPTKRRIALDIAPQAKGIERADFLQWTPPKKARYAVLGNPPFGIRGATALAFINRAALFADIVAFILPMTFASDGKGGAMTRVQGLQLLHSEELSPASFYDGDGNQRDINTVFQVWGARNLTATQPMPACDEFAEIRTVCTNPNRRCGTHRMGEYDYFLQGTFYDNRPPRVVQSFDEVRYGSGYGIIIKKRKRDVARALCNADWMEHSSRATNHCRHIRMRHIRDALILAGFKDGDK